MIYAIIVISILAFIILPYELIPSIGVSNGCLSNSFLYLFMHASWLHLIINCISMLILWNPVCRIYTTRYNSNDSNLILAMLAAAILAGAACATGTPTVGMSGCVFFLLGALIMLNPTKQQVLNYIWVALTILVQIFFGKSNVALHIFAFVEGCAFVCVRELFHQYKQGIGLFGIK